MNYTVENNGIVYAGSYSLADVPDENKTKWFGKETEPLQGSLMHYMKGKVFRNHKHKLNPRLINRTQECFIVIRGKIQIDIYERLSDIEIPESNGIAVVHSRKGEPAIHLGSLTASQGDIIFVWRGFHKLSILEDYTLAYEIKAGQFTSVLDDKEFLDIKEEE